MKFLITKKANIFFIKAVENYVFFHLIRTKSLTKLRLGTFSDFKSEN